MPSPTSIGQIALTRYEARDTDGLRPCVVLAHGFGATASSGLAGFGEAFAAAGVDAITFDYRGFGLSGGEPRGVVSVKAQLEDYRTVIAHARSLPEIDPERIVVWGVSFAGGHVLQIAATDPRLAAAVALTPAVDGAAVVQAMVRRDGLRPLLGLTALAVRDLAARLRGRPRVMSPIAAAPGELGALTAPGALAAYEGVAGPDWRNEVAAEIFLTLGTHRPVSDAKRVSCPILMQIADGDRSVPPTSSVKAAVKARAQIRHYDGDHFDVYPGGPAHAGVLGDQLLFLSRTLGLSKATPAAAAA